MPRKADRTFLGMNCLEDCRLDIGVGDLDMYINKTVAVKIPLAASGTNDGDLVGSITGLLLALLQRYAGW